MPYDNIITRNDASALIPIEDFSSQVIEGVVRESSVLNLFRRLPNMTAKQAKLRVLDSMPDAYWVDGDTGLKNTTKLKWENKFITAEELAVIIPISEAVLDDANYDIWAEAQPRIIEAIGKKIDQAVYFGIDKPTSWRNPLVPSAVGAGATVEWDDENDPLYNAIDKAMSYVELSGYAVNGLAGSVGLKSAFRRMLDSTGQPLQATEISGLKRAFVDNGAWTDNAAVMIVGDFSQAVYSIRQDVTFKLLDQSVISDADGKIVYNLAQQDMVALRVVFRMGWEIPNPINALSPHEDLTQDPNSGTGINGRFPFSVLVKADGNDSHPVQKVFTLGDATGSAYITDDLVTVNMAGVIGNNDNGYANVPEGEQYAKEIHIGTSEFPANMKLTYVVTSNKYAPVSGVTMNDGNPVVVKLVPLEA